MPIEFTGTWPSAMKYAEEARAAFRELAADERDHSRQLEVALQLPRPDRIGFNRNAWSKVDHVLQLARNVLAPAEARPCLKKAALRLAITLAKNFVKSRLDNAVHFHSQRLAESFRGLGRSDQEHLDLRRNCLRWRRRQRRIWTQPDSSG